MKILLAPGTSLAFDDDDSLVVKLDYQQLLGPCPADCSWDHNCYEEPYVAIVRETRTALPLSKLRHVFGADHRGRDFDVSREVE